MRRLIDTLREFLAREVVIHLGYDLRDWGVAVWFAVEPSYGLWQTGAQLGPLFYTVGNDV